MRRREHVLRAGLHLVADHTRLGHRAEQGLRPDVPAESQQAVVVDGRIRAEYRRVLVEAEASERHHRDRARRRLRPRALRALGQPLGVACVEPRDCVAEVPFVELLDPRRARVGRRLDQRVPLDFEAAVRDLGVRRALGSGDVDPREGQRIAERREDVVVERETAPMDEHAHETVDDLALALRRRVEVLVEDQVLGVERADGGFVARAHRCVEPARLFRRGVGPDGPLGRRARRDERVEARERLGLAIGVEPLGAREPAVGVGREEHEEGPLVDAAAETLGAGVHAPDEQRARRERENLGRGQDDVVGDLVQRAHVLEERVRAAQRPRAQRPVVDRLEVGREHRRDAIERVRRRHHGAQRSRRRRGELALGAFGQQLGVALVESVTASPSLSSSKMSIRRASPCRSDLDHEEYGTSRRADRSRSEPSSRSADAAQPAQRERLAERRERLVHQRAVGGLLDHRAEPLDGPLRIRTWTPCG